MIKTNRHYSAAIQRWQQRRVLRSLKREAPTQLKREKEQLAQLWDGNPAAQCATLFDRFKRWPPPDANPEEVADEVDRAIMVASSLFEQNVTTHYADLYANRLVVRTTELAEELAALYPDNAAVILQKLSQNDGEISRRFNQAIRDALAEDHTDRVEVRARIKQLIGNSERFRKLLTPGFFRKYGSSLFGGGAALALHELLPDLVKGPWIEYQTGKFAARVFDSFKTKGDQDFVESFGKAMALLPALCEGIDARVGRGLCAVFDGYIEHKLKHQRAISDVLLELSHARCNLEPGISWFKNATRLGSIAASGIWSRSFATAGVVLFIGTLCAVWVYSPVGKKAPATAGSPENQELATAVGKSQMDIGLTLTGTQTAASADHSTAASTALMTPVVSNPPEYLAQPADTVEEKKTATNQAGHRALQSASPDVKEYPLARYAGTPGWYRSPYTGRLYNLRGVRGGGRFGTPTPANCSAVLGKTPRQIQRGVSFH